MSQTFSDVFSYASLKEYSGLASKTKLAFPDCYLGIEVEAEHISNVITVPHSWNILEDGSLKLSGKEFVTVPIKSKYLEIELKRLFTTIASANFSQRTSIHVHMNARDFSKEELEVFLCLYILFERALFFYSGGRNHSNFCVPLYMDGQSITAVFKLLKRDGFSLDHLINTGWSKYSALNMVPMWGGDGVKRHGTIEFRHMKGNNNISYIMGWCNLITSLKLFAKSNSVDTLFKKYLDTRNMQLVKDVFTSWSSLIEINEKDFITSIGYLKFLR